MQGLMLSIAFRAEAKEYTAEPILRIRYELKELDIGARYLVAYVVWWGRVPSRHCYPTLHVG